MGNISNLVPIYTQIKDDVIFKICFRPTSSTIESGSMIIFVVNADGENAMTTTVPSSLLEVTANEKQQLETFLASKLSIILDDTGFTVFEDG